MAVNKVIYGGQTVIDLTSDSVTPETLVKGATAHDKSGAQIVGTYEAQTENLDTELTEQESLISQLSTILDSKASGGGTLKTCTVTINDGGNLLSVIYDTVSNGKRVGAISRLDEDPNYMWNDRNIEVVVGSLLIACGGDNIDWFAYGEINLEASITNDYVGSGYTYLFRVNGSGIMDGA